MSAAASILAAPEVRSGQGKADRPLRVLTFTTLFPNSVLPSFGIFVETRLRQLVASGTVESRVVAPVPWFPSTHPKFGQYASFARVPAREERNGLAVEHPRYAVIPKVGMNLAPLTLALAALPALRRIQRSGFDFDVIDAHYYYPDGVAAALLSRWLGKPFVVTARGTDINLIPQHRLPRRMILWAERQAAASIAVCEALKDEIVELGVDSKRVRVLRNGVDLVTFSPRPREAARRDLKLNERGRIALSVGYLIERKGHHLAIEAIASLPDWTLVICGKGEEERALRALADRLGVSGRVRFEGEVPQRLLPDYYNAADVLILASSREGMANVLLESLACGTPVVATALWGTPEVIAVPEAGVLMKERSAAALVDSISRLAQSYPDRSDTRRYAERFGWAQTTAGQIELFNQIVRGHDAATTYPVKRLQ